MDFQIGGDPFDLNKLIDLKEYLKNKPLDVEMTDNSILEADVSSKTKDTDPDRSQKYMLHDGTTRGLFFYWRVQKGLSVRDAASRANVSHSTANNWYRKSRPVSQLQEPHKQYLANFFDENPSAVITDAVEGLTAAFGGLDIKKSRVHEYMKDECNFSLKIATLHPGPRNDEKSLEKRLSRAWSRKGTEAVIPVASTKAASHTVIGAISAICVINITMRVPMPPKKIKIQGGKKENLSHPKTLKRKVQQLAMISILLERHWTLEMKGFYLIMDYAPIHSSNEVKQIVEDRKKDYICVHLPELNLIEQFWAIIKQKVKRNQLMESETLA
ncbi:hypothetical protein INT47_003634 [Mucor saturninus]|uniref:Tc1-like transposase DDE domain-containing protein n=1 Tax=Mucor saturninus TaxID=64648 RepID=A0A8H7V5Y1_9FUNG|nr:hypothetical protein INT47_003634 [Mucor saturninus]